MCCNIQFCCSDACELEYTHCCTQNRNKVNSPYEVSSGSYTFCLYVIAYLLALYVIP